MGWTFASVIWRRANVTPKIILGLDQFKKQIQPSSVDLSLSNECYEIKTSFLSPKNKVRDKLKDMRSESIAFESSITNLQNELNLIESNDRENILIRERLITENKAIKKNIKNFKQREIEMIEILNSYDNQLKIKKHEFSKLSKDKALLDKEFRYRELE